MVSIKFYYLKTDSITDVEQLKKVMEELQTLGFDSTIVEEMQGADTERYESREVIKTPRILPKDIDTSLHFTCAFGNMETETSARHIVRLCQKENNWLPFTLEEIIDNVFNECGKYNFTFSKLLSQGFILHRGKDYYITPEFIQRCYETSLRGKNYDSISRKGNEIYEEIVNFNTTHPELRPGETFYTNVSLFEDLSKYNRQIMRFGKQAFTNTGKETNGLPVFKMSPTKIDMTGSNIPYQKVFLKITAHQDALDTLGIFKKDNNCKTCKNNQCVHSGIVMNNLCLYHTNGTINTLDSLRKERGTI